MPGKLPHVTAALADGSLLIVGPENRLLGSPSADSAVHLPVGAKAFLDLDVSSDGGWIAFSFNSGVVEDPAQDPERWQLGIVHPDGTGSRILISSEYLDGLFPDGLKPDPNRPLWPHVEGGVGEIQFLPGTHKILWSYIYHLYTAGWMQDWTWEDTLIDAYVTDSDTGETTPFVQSRMQGKFFPSPDGRWIAIVQDDKVSLSRADGSAFYPSLFAFDPSYLYISTNLGMAYHPEAFWASDSTRFGVIVPPTDPIAGEPTARLFMVDAASRRSRELSIKPDCDVACSVSKLSPDLTHLLTWSASHHAVMDISLADGTVRKVSDDSIHFGWNPFGKEYWNSPFSGPGAVSSAEGVKLLPLVGFVHDLLWFDSSRFVYSTDTSAGQGLSGSYSISFADSLFLSDFSEPPERLIEGKDIILFRLMP